MSFVINPYRFGGGGGFDGFGNASREFDGTSDFITIGDVLESVFTGVGVVMTVAAWVKPDGTGDGEIISSYTSNATGQFVLRHFSATEEIGVIVGSDTWTNRFGRQTSTSGSVANNVWTHIAFVYTQADTGSHIKFYIDGVEYVEADTEVIDFVTAGTFSSIANTSAELIIGRNPALTSIDFDGNIADFRIYDADIGANINGLSNGTDYQTNLVGWWITDVDDVDDYAGENNGTNSGSTYDAEGPNG